MKLRTRLILGLGSLLLVLLVLASYAVNLMDKQNRRVEEIVSERYEQVELATVIGSESNSIARRLRDAILDQGQTNLPDYIQQIEHSNTLLGSSLISLKASVKEDEVQKLIADLESQNLTYQDYQRKIIHAVQVGNRTDAIKQLGESKKVRTRLDELVGKINTFEKKAMHKALADSQRSYRTAIYMFFSMLLVGLLLGALIALWLIRNITGSLGYLTKAIQKVSRHQDQTKLPRLVVLAQDELGVIAEAFNDMAASLEQHAKQEKEYTQQIQEQHWIKSSVGEIADLFQGVQDTENMAQLLFSRLAPIVGVSYGAFYVLEGHAEQRKMIRRGSYAVSGQDLGSSTLALGEGLAGQCAQENRVITLTGIPANYIEIHSALGSAPAQAVTVLPVAFEGEVLAVLELASLQSFTPVEQEVLEQVRQITGITLKRIFKHMQVQKLLAESQALTEELQSQSEELQLQQEELRTFNEQLEEQYKKSEQKTVELQRTQEALEEKAGQLAISSQYKSEFLSNMSHELRTPLNSMLILSGLLAENREGHLSAKQVEYSETILASGRDLLNLINDILDLAKIEAGKVQIKTESVGLTGLLTSLERQFKPEALQKGLDFRIQLEKDVRSILWTDELRLSQILKNLLTNALKFTHRGGVQLKIFRAPGVLGAEPLLAFQVIDTGIGIPQDKQELVFEAFQQVDGTTSRKYGGTGLGLSISRELASLLGGYLALESVEGKGSTFTLYVPNPVEPLASKPEVAVTTQMQDAEPAEPAAEPLTPSSGDLQGRRVLVVDDDMRNVFAITAALEGYHIDVAFAENGREAIEKLEQNPGIELVLMDIMMPGMDGYQAIKAIRGMTGYGELPIIAITAKAMQGDREKCLQAGASDYISKPFQMEQLLSLMRVWLYRQVK